LEKQNVRNALIGFTLAILVGMFAFLPQAQQTSAKVGEKSEVQSVVRNTQGLAQEAEWECYPADSYQKPMTSDEISCRSSNSNEEDVARCLESASIELINKDIHYRANCDGGRTRSSYCDSLKDELYTALENANNIHHSVIWDSYLFKSITERKEGEWNIYAPDWADAFLSLKEKGQRHYTPSEGIRASDGRAIMTSTFAYYDPFRYISDYPSEASDFWACAMIRPLPYLADE